MWNWLSRAVETARTWLVDAALGIAERVTGVRYGVRDDDARGGGGGGGGGDGGGESDVEVWSTDTLVDQDYRGPFLTHDEAKDYSSAIPATTFVVVVDGWFYVIVEES